MLLERMLRLLDFILDKGGPFYLVLKMLANLIPHYLGLAIPVAFFVGMLLAVMRLSGDSELDAIYAMGGGLRPPRVAPVGAGVGRPVGPPTTRGFLRPSPPHPHCAPLFSP